MLLQSHDTYNFNVQVQNSNIFWKVFFSFYFFQIIHILKVFSLSLFSNLYYLIIKSIFKTTIIRLNYNLENLVNLIHFSAYNIINSFKLFSDIKLNFN